MALATLYIYIRGAGVRVEVTKRDHVRVNVRVKMLPALKAYVLLTECIAFQCSKINGQKVRH